MAKVIKYKFLSGEVSNGTEENPNIEQILLNKSLSWSEVNEKIAKQEAYNGEYTIEDDGVEEVIDMPTTEERVEALEAAVTMLCMPDISEV